MQPQRDAGELGDERARHRNIGLRAIDGIGPVHRHEATVVARFAALPVLFSHMHAERRLHLLGIGDDVDLVSPRRQRMGRPIGAHAYATLNGRKLADEADSHPCTSMSPAAVRSARSFANSAPLPDPPPHAGEGREGAGSVQSSSATSRSKIAGTTSNTCGLSAPGGKATTNGVSRFTGTAFSDAVSNIGRMS